MVANYKNKKTRRESCKLENIKECTLIYWQVLLMMISVIYYNSDVM